MDNSNKIYTVKGTYNKNLENSYMKLTNKKLENIKKNIVINKRKYNKNKDGLYYVNTKSMVQTEKPSIFYPFVQTPYIEKKYYIDELKLCGSHSCFFTLYDINSKKKNKYNGIKILKNKKKLNENYILNK